MMTGTGSALWSLMVQGVEWSAQMMMIQSFCASSGSSTASIFSIKFRFCTARPSCPDSSAPLIFTSTKSFVVSSCCAAAIFPAILLSTEPVIPSTWTCSSPMALPMPVIRLAAEITLPLRPYFCENGSNVPISPAPRIRTMLAGFRPFFSRSPLTGWSKRILVDCFTKSLQISAVFRSAGVCRISVTFSGGTPSFLGSLEETQCPIPSPLSASAARCPAPDRKENSTPYPERSTPFAIASLSACVSWILPARRSVMMPSFEIVAKLHLKPIMPGSIWMPVPSHSSGPRPV